MAFVVAIGCFIAATFFIAVATSASDNSGAWIPLYIAALLLLEGLIALVIAGVRALGAHKPRRRPALRAWLD